MTTDIATLAAQVAGFTDEAGFVRAYLELQDAIAFLKEQKDKLTRAGLEWMENNDIKEIWLEKDKLKLYRTKKVKTKFDTEAIYKALSFTDEQVAVLPKNPDFRKTAVLANEKTAPAHYETEEDVLVLKEVDMDMMKKLGRA